MTLEVVWDHHHGGWGLEEGGERDPLPDHLTLNAPDAKVVDLVRETFVIKPEDEIVVVRDRIE